ncbi:MAG TPA: DUF2252 domain-containing protein [Pseudonocardiaceae bacterium]|nr:DUF2252 domain-containing protein [Pseudonocardiaceae bacterium]
MTLLTETLLIDDSEGRRHRIVDTLTDAFAELMAAAPAAFRTKFRKMAADPFSFYRGSACLFYADVVALDDPWADERTSRVWIQGDLHAENFGTYMDGNGVLIFDVNDFDEAYLGHFTWDLQRMVASIALLGWRKALSDTDIDALVETYVRAYTDQVRWFVDATNDRAYSLRLNTTDGAIHQVLQLARLRSRFGLLEAVTETEGFDRRFRNGPGVRRLDDAERSAVCAAVERYLGTIPERKRFRGITYTIKDVVGRSGFGIGSAGLPAYNLLIEGYNQALDNDVVLSMKQGNVAAPSRVVTDERIASYFQHHGHRTAISQRALQAHADPLLGYTELDGVGYLVSELSPYVTDLDWSELTEPDEIAPVLDYLGRATAKVHCVSDSDSDHTLVPFQTEEAIAAVIGDREAEFVDWLTTFAREYAAVVRDDHRLFVDAFRNNEITGVRSTHKAELVPGAISAG